MFLQVKTYLNHIYNGHHSFVINIILLIGGLSVATLINMAAGVFTFSIKAIYDFRKLREQKRQLKKNLEEEKIKEALYQEYLQKQKQHIENEI